MDGGSNSKNEVWGYESYPQTSDLLQYTAIHKRDHQQTHMKIRHP